MDAKFCENLKNARKDAGLTQKQVAEVLNVVESCYANLEQGRTEPNVYFFIIKNILFFSNKRL